MTITRDQILRRRQIVRKRGISLEIIAHKRSRLFSSSWAGGGNYYPRIDKFLRTQIQFNGGLTN